MSRSTDKDIKSNPCKKFLKWSTIKENVTLGEGEDAQVVEKIKGGTFVSYNKDLKINEPITLPLSFAILNKDMISFKGYDEGRKRGVWSNEVNSPDQLVTIQAKGEKLLTFRRGEYKLNSAKVKELGAKYTNSVYIAVKEGKDWETWNLQLSGAALSGAPENSNKPTEEEKKEGWFNFTNNNRGKLNSNMVEVKTYKIKKKGATKFSIPIYTIGEEIDGETGEILDSMDKELIEYLDYYFSTPTVVSTSEVLEPVDSEMEY